MSSDAPRRGRRPKTYAAVLEATSGLLASTSLAELSVADILAAADVGRTSFYEHFSSKDDVVVKLVRRIRAEVGDELEPMFSRGDRSPDAAFREGLANLIRASSRYAPLLVAVAEEWPSIPELQELWFQTLGALTGRLIDTIEQDRAAGIAPRGANAAGLAAALVWSAERAFHVAMTGHHPTLTDRESVIEPLVQLFVGSIYGRAVQPAGRG
ncbi:MAG TPA: TetR/AcrR family transcriptional regulator [Solirubrobacteraceae bacterium]